MISFSNSLSRGSGMPNQVDGAFVRYAMSGTELSRVRTEFRLRPPERINQSLLGSKGPTWLCNQVLLGKIHMSGKRVNQVLAFRNPGWFYDQGSLNSLRTRIPWWRCATRSLNEQLAPVSVGAS